MSTKICREISLLVKIGQNDLALHMKTYVRFMVAGNLNNHNS